MGVVSIGSGGLSACPHPQGVKERASSKASDADGESEEEDDVNVDEDDGRICRH